MKKITTLLLSLLVIGQIWAQSPVLPELGRDYSGKELGKAKVSAEDSERIHEYITNRNEDNTRGGVPGYWVSFSEAVEFSGSTPFDNLIRATLWPDSLPIIADAVNGDFHWFIHAMCNNFDPGSQLINDTYITSPLDVGFTGGKKFIADSTAFYFIYQRATGPEIIDTLRAYVYEEPNISEQLFNDWPGTGENTDVCYALYDGNNFRPDDNIIFEWEYLLTEEDTSDLIQVITESLEETIIDQDSKLGIAFHYIPGQPYALGDVLFDNDALTLGTLNSFDIITFEEDEDLFPFSSVTDEGALNQAGIVETEIRYQTNELGWNITYYPTFGFADGWASEHILTDWYVSPIGAHFIAADGGTCTKDFNDLSNVSDITNWLWDFGTGGDISLDQNPTYTFPGNGTYEVCLQVRDNDFETFETCLNVVVTNCVSAIEDIASLKDFSLYPNPASDIVNMEVEFNQTENIDVQIFNQNGQIVYQNNMNNTFNIQERIDVSGMAPGLYTVTLSTGDQISSKNFMISR